MEERKRQFSGLFYKTSPKIPSRRYWLFVPPRLREPIAHLVQQLSKDKEEVPT
jgi:hypothetical protein